MKLFTIDFSFRAIVYTLPVLMCFTSLLANASKGEDGNKSEGLCINIISDVKRLSCFDKRYKTPSYFSPESASESSDVTTIPDFIRKAYQREKNRPVPSEGFLEDVSGTIENKVVRLSSLSHGNYSYQPLLLISCVDNITRMQIGLTHAIDAASFSAKMTMDNGVSTDYMWRSSGGGYVIDVGRGLYSIKLINSLFDKNYVDVDLKEVGIDKIRFDITGLSDSIKNLRQACHW
jgi:type VI secretion system protein VasI